MTRNDATKDLQGFDYGVGRRLMLGGAVIVLMFGGVGAWAMTSDLSGAVISQGSVVVDEHSKRVQHRDGGIVAAIQVANGDHVQQNDVLIKLDDTQVRAELSIVDMQLIEMKSRKSRLMAEQELAGQITFPPELLTLAQAKPIMDSEARLFGHNIRTREGQELQLRQRIEQLSEESNGYSVQKTAKANELALIRKELGDTRQLFAKSLTPASKLYALEREESRIDGERGNYIAQEARIAGQISEVEQQILTLRQVARTEAQKELRTVEARVEELEARQFAARDKLGRMDIRAPQAGVVNELAVHTVGGVISPAEQIMLIVPTDVRRTAEFKLSPAAIDQVHVGQAARLRFSSFNQRTTPELSAEVIYISADVTRDAKDRQEFYTARAVLTEDLPQSLTGKRILPGMPVEVFVTTEKRSALSYFLKPMADQFTRAFKER
jgi:HlyD family secretion protein